MQFSEEKQAAMRAAFQADLAARLAAIEQIIEQLRAGQISTAAASAAVLAHLHDIKGCGTPYGFPEASDLARSYEAQLRKSGASKTEVTGVLMAAARDFCRLTI